VAHPPYWQEAVKLELCVLHINHMATMINPKGAVRRPILPVDDDIQQLDLLALTMKTSGFSVVTASTPIEAISLINDHCLREIDAAVGMNGCVLAAYLQARCPELKIVSYSGARDISQDEKMRVDAFISQRRWYRRIALQDHGVRTIDPASPTVFALENDAFIEGVNQRATREPSQERAIMSSGQHLGNHD
jgi:CheY-like chemotaxis protein